MVALIMLSPIAGQAATLPQGGSITVGQGTIVTNGSNEMVIKQTTDKLGINWDSFNVGADGRVVFDQPGVNSVALNRVIGSDGSAILGKIDANGQVFLVNPNGVIFGKNSKVNVGGLIASTLSISDADFVAGNYSFKGQAADKGEVVNNGSIEAAQGGYVALIGKSVKNNGAIRAKLGTAALAAGNAVTLDFSGDGLIKIQVNESAVNALAENKGLIKADGGNVLMTARASNALLQTVVNNEGIIEAQTIENRSGKIFLDGGFKGGVVNVAGTLDSSAAVAGNGGFIETSGSNVRISSDVKITTLAAKGVTGQWLIDPTDFTINAGAGSQTINNIGADTLAAALQSTNVSLATSSIDTPGESGNINVNASFAWDADTKLTLTAHNDININSQIAVNGESGGLDLNYGGRVNVSNGGSVKLKGASTTYAENGNDFQILRTVDDLAIFQSGESGMQFYALGGDIDASVMSTWDGGKGFASYGDLENDGEAIYGITLNGLGNTISDFYVNRPDRAYVGLLGALVDSTISNINITGTAVGADKTGLLVGEAVSSNIYNIGSTGGTVSGGKWVGGLIGYVYTNSTVENVSSGVDVTGTGDSVGGAIGYTDSNILIKGIHGYGHVTGYKFTGGAIGSSFADGNVMDISSGATSVVTGQITTGGAMGAFSGSPGKLSNVSGSGVVNGDETAGGALGYGYGTMVNLKSDATVNGTSSVGGLIGEMHYSNLSESFATGTVTGTGDRTGGLVGSSVSSTIFDSLSMGNVTGTSNTGGFVGQSYDDTISTSFSTSKVNGTENVGGFVGTNNMSRFKDVYATGEVNASVYFSGGFAGVSWSSTFTNAYSTGKNSSSGSFGGGFMGSSSGDTLTNVLWDMDTSGYTTSAGGVGKTSAQMMDSSTFADWGVSTDGGADSNVWRIYEGKTTPVLKFLMGTATIHQNDIITTYTSNAYTPVIPSDMNSVSNLTYNTFFESLLDLTGAGLKGGDFAGSPAMIKAGNYNATSSLYSGQFGLNITQENVGKVVIEKAKLDLTTSAQNKVYDATTGAAASVTANGLGSDVLTVTDYDAAFSDKNAGTVKTVTINGITITGDAIDNYTWETSVTTTADITKADLSVGASGIDKTYDGSTNASVYLSYSGIAGDSISVSYGSAQFSDKNAGVGKTIDVYGYTLNGADAGNYNIVAAPSSVTATISKAVLDVSAAASGKVYDGSVAASTSLSDNRVLGDDLVLSSSGSSFADKNAGAGKTVTVNGISVSGSDAGNYTWNTSATTTADISKANLVIGASGQDKTYDGGVSAGASLNDNRVVGDDLVIGGSAHFLDKNAGAGKTIVVDCITVSGADAANYSWNVDTTTTGTINKASLNVSATASDKTYDGSTAASTVLTDDRITGDDIVVSGTSTFSDKNAGSGKVVTVDGITLSGADADNYIVNTSSTTTATINKAVLDVTASASDKVYDGSVTANTTLSDNRVSGDSLTITSSGSSFADKNAGTGKTVSVGGITVSGADAGNYEWNTTTATTADISKANLAIGAIGQDKTYDGGLSAEASLTDNRIAGDDLVIGGSAHFDDKNAGAGKTITINGISVSGADADNYIWNSTVSTTATINKAFLDITAIGKDKTYNGTKDAQVSFTDKRVDGDDLVITSAGNTFSDANAGYGKTITSSGVSVSGADAGNYTWNTTLSSTALIGKANIVVVANPGSKTEGALDGALGWHLGSGQLFGNDKLTGALAREAGEAAGEYVISKGSLSAGSNYTLSVIPGVFEIMKPLVNTNLEEAKNVVATITSGSGAHSPRDVEPMGITTNYRLLNLGIKLPDDIFKEEI
nr:YDG domain-containing protein [Pseudomonas putida]